MTALGAYLRTLRIGQRMTQTLAAELAGINVSTLHRIEKGESEPGGENVLNLVSVVRGSYEDARRLWSDRSADEDAGRETAEQRLGHANFAKLEELHAVLGDERLVDLVAMLAANPDKVDAIIRLVGDGSTRRQQ